MYIFCILQKRKFYDDDSFFFFDSRVTIEIKKNNTKYIFLRLLIARVKFAFSLLDFFSIIIVYVSSKTHENRSKTPGMRKIEGGKKEKESCEEGKREETH